ncbi:branched-chain amino acid ABC transporter permease [Celeribacter baekdonensis]|uniref:Branched-chain amino acid ABC transporter permease n=1 Tax=Celeribacter baekdonensis TaxID=875171 RepID=A0A2R4M1V1_9RHOB|nr:branched-chain amino acid ABC transporter permease [Celeribacter baekdonensis]AVW91079.1 branched-chain amino acid ABC transporter permease [Celeribacter baekdonensis]
MTSKKPKPFLSSEAILALALVAALIILAAAPWWASRSDIRLMGEFFSFLGLAVLWNLLAGYAGLLSVGQQAFVGIGGYTLFVISAKIGLSPYIALLTAPLAGALVAAIFAPLLFRLNGAYFAIGTWVAAETISLCFGMIPELGGGAGMSLPVATVKAIAANRPDREAYIYWMLLSMGMGTLIGAYLLLRSKAGLALMAIRDNSLAAGSLGIDIWKTKFLIYVGVAAVTSLLGAVIFLQKLRISPDSAFNVNDWTVYIIFIVVIGGIGRLEGALLGTILFFITRELLADLGAVYLIVLGLIAIVTMLISRVGLWGLLEQKTGWTIFPVTRKVD